MRNSKLPTVTVGIPAYNEEGNLMFLLESILRQKAISYRLHEIIIICDGCTDKTAIIAKEISKSHRNIRVVARKQRRGKSQALNHLYRIFDADFLFQPDADLVMADENVIEELVKPMIQFGHVNLTSPTHTAYPDSSFWATMALYSYDIFAEAMVKYRDGVNAYTVMGASMIRGTFAKRHKYPKGIIGDQTFLFASVMNENAEGYAFVKKANVYFRTIASFAEWRALAVRSTLADKQTVLDKFGSDIVAQYYTLPRNLYVQSIIGHFLKNPFITIGVFGMEVFIRVFPLKKSSVADGKWDPNLSSKVGIRLAS